MYQRKSRVLRGMGVLLATAGLTLTANPDALAGTAQPGASGVGDSLFPHLGNGGYNAGHYTLRLTYPTAEPAGRVQGIITMTAVATQDLSSFNLDYSGDAITSVRVDGRPAWFDWQQQTGELVITPQRLLCRGRGFTAEIGFTSHPTAPEPDNLFPVGWIATPHGSFTSFQPDTAHQAIPVNDHPSDPATWTFELDVPQGITAVTNGVPAGQRTVNGRTVWIYEQHSPLPTELVQLAVGDDLSLVDRGTLDDVTYRDVIANGQRDLLEPAFAQGSAQLDWAIDKIGDFPHEVYGNLGIDLPFGYALETEGLTLHSTALFDPSFLPGRSGQEWFYSAVMVHEIAHEWYGDSVMPRRWSDVWDNEAWATYLMTLWEQEKGTLDEWGYPSLEDYMKQVYAQGDIWRAQYGPVARPLSAETLFSPQVYEGGALVLYALQQMVGPKTFWKIAHGWPQQYRGRPASTDDFIDYVNHTSGQNLTQPLRAWLYGDHIPPMPGHPDWTVLPVTATTTAATPAHQPGTHGREFSATRNRDYSTPDASR